MQCRRLVGQRLDDELGTAQYLHQRGIETRHFRVLVDMSDALVGEPNFTPLVIPE